MIGQGGQRRAEQYKSGFSTWPILGLETSEQPPAAAPTVGGMGCKSWSVCPEWCAVTDNSPLPLLRRVSLTGGCVEFDEPQQTKAWKK